VTLPLSSLTNSGLLKYWAMLPSGAGLVLRSASRMTKHKQAPQVGSTRKPALTYLVLSATEATVGEPVRVSPQ
jgi:hypothetical protein